MKYLHLILIVFILIILGCSDSHESPIHCQIAKKIIDEFIDDVKQKNYLYCDGGGGEFMDKINLVNLSFLTNGPMSIDELRILMINITQAFLDKINNHKEARIHLINYPFNHKNLTIRITLLGKDLKSIKNKGNKKDLLYGIILMKGKLFYEIINEDKPYLQNIRKETYEEALEIVEK